MLTPERLTEMRRADDGALNFVSMRAFEIIARAVEAEVRKQDEALIRQLRDALALEVLEWEPAFLAGLYESEDPAENIARAQILAALKAAKARLAES